MASRAITTAGAWRRTLSTYLLENAMSIALLFLIAAGICFLIAVLPIPVRINLIALGLLLWVISLLVGGVVLH